METLVLGDTHGRTIWKEIADQHFDNIIFIGDYFDTHENISVRQQIQNFKDIIAFKRSSGKQVVLLIGNHDYHYMEGVDEQYSGFNYRYKAEISELLYHAKDELQICYFQDGIAFSHAGITNTWLSNNVVLDGRSLADSINGLFKTNPAAFKFTPGENYDVYGDDITQTPIWVRPDSLMMDAINYKHVVGHTTQYNLVVVENRFYFIDTLGTSREYLKIIDGNITIKTARKK